MKVTITVTMDNAAFRPTPGDELARILRELAQHVENRDMTRVRDAPNLYDVNGNRVGTVVVQGELE